VAEGVRADKWLWAVRAFSTRALAQKACAAGRVTIDDDPIKPARKVSVGDTLHIRKGAGLVLIYTVERLIEKRVSAKIAADCITDLSPPPPPRLPAHPHAHRAPGAGRPTKRERREMERFRSS
jgi:ribosome-associated heat shock protein Hsp15